MQTLILLIPATCFLILTLEFEKKRALKPMLAAKTCVSALFVLAAGVQSPLDPVYYALLLTGLVLCLGGDVFLAIPSERAFMAGLISFFLGHVAYVGAFIRLGRFAPVLAVWALALAVAGFFIFRWLSPNLGDMKKPVAAYVLVISCMVLTAFGVGIAPGFSPAGRAMVVLGALLFYASDIFVAKDRFIKPDFENRVIGLPLYYAGQFFLAYSPGFL